MDYQEIDRLIGQLGYSQAAIVKLEALGEPALRRLFDVVEGAVRIPSGGDPRDSYTNEAVALGRLGARHPDVLLALVEGRTDLKLGTIEGLGFTGDQKLKAIAQVALKTYGNDR